MRDLQYAALKKRCIDIDSLQPGEGTQNNRRRRWWRRRRWRRRVAAHQTDTRSAPSASAHAGVPCSAGEAVAKSSTCSVPGPSAAGAPPTGVSATRMTVTKRGIIARCSCSQVEPTTRLPPRFLVRKRASCDTFECESLRRFCESFCTGRNIPTTMHGASTKARFTFSACSVLFCSWKRCACPREILLGLSFVALGQVYFVFVFVFVFGPCAI